ncbi:hypothetical protein P1X15_30890 [Runella sp. MFBS21]|uniref:hypothetical protein n=1 Tax=Runella sp. MFBS21 TaxID=3034018 RepID=UPI0023F9F1F8|nr:hypothetical protein [Runella sp. MFBS21]MDF7822063.1 hypothetical protein [Runella sp. MFBS21]
MNQATIEEQGGSLMPHYYFVYEENLNYLLDCVKAAIFGVSIYLCSIIIDKDALDNRKILRKGFRKKTMAYKKLK